jgi:hypothetical protein
MQHNFSIVMHRISRQIYLYQDDDGPERRGADLLERASGEVAGLENWNVVERPTP